MCNKAIKQSYIAERFATEIEKFIIDFHKCRTAAAANPLGPQGARSTGTTTA